MRALGDEYFVFDPVRYTLVGDESGKVYRLGQRVAVTLKSADATTASLEFVLAGSRLRAEAPDCAAPATDDRKISRSSRGHRRMGSSRGWRTCGLRHGMVDARARPDEGRFTVSFVDKYVGSRRGHQGGVHVSQSSGL